MLGSMFERELFARFKVSSVEAVLRKSEGIKSNLIEIKVLTYDKPFVSSCIILFSTEIDCTLTKYSKGFVGSVLIKLSSKFNEITLESPEILEIRLNLFSAFQLQNLLSIAIRTLVEEEATYC